MTVLKSRKENYVNLLLQMNDIYYNSHVFLSAVTLLIADSEEPAILMCLYKIK